MSAVLTAADAAAFAACIEQGGVAVFPADTVYGLACDPENTAAVARLYELKGRPPAKPAAVMWFDVERALATLPHLGARTRAACERLLPGQVTLLLPDPSGRFPLAAGLDPRTGPAPERDPHAALGVRVPSLTGPLAALAAMPHAVLQSSANLAGRPDARSLDGVPTEIRDGADLVLDAGALPGTPSTVVDLRDYEAEGRFAIVRAGAVSAGEVAKSLGIVSGPP